MYWRNAKTSVFLIFLIIFVDCAVSQCIEFAPCFCVREDGEGYDLRSLEHEGPFVSEQSEQHHNFTFQPCKNVDLTFNASKASNNTTTECKSTSICMLNEKNESISLGMVEDTIWKLPIENDDVSLVFRHANYETKITLLCCYSCKLSMLNFDNVNGNNYELTFHSQKNCLITMKSRGLSTGSVLVILLFVFSALYLIGGALALRIFRGAVGLELIPNYDFWCDLPALVRDGVTFTLSGCSAVSYERI